MKIRRKSPLLVPVTPSLYNSIMKINVVIPVFNSEQYLSECLDSVVSQTYGDIGIILIDDGSTDSSGKMCDRYASSDPRIRVIHTENHGVSVARNTGIAESDGDYVCFIDSDDYVAPDYVEYLLKLITDHEADISVCQMMDSRRKMLENRILTDNRSCMSAFVKTAEIDSVVWGKLFKRNLFDGVLFPAGKRYEDEFTIYKLIAKADRIAVGCGSKYYYRENDKSFMNSVFSDKDFEWIEAMTEQKCFMEQNYPELTSAANARIIYAVNKCAEKMSAAGVYQEDRIKEMKALYKAYEKDFLRGKSGFSAKMFSIAASINLKAAMKMLHSKGSSK